jgi:hypothetical protein
MADKLTPKQLDFLKRVRDAGQDGYNQWKPSREIRALAALGYLTEQAVSLDNSVFALTDKGVRALRSKSGMATS